MYEEYFGFKRKPFSLVPDTHYFFVSAGHREALAHLLFGIKSDGGFVLLTGEVGTGKTTVCRRFLEVLPEDTDVAFILNPKVTVQELLANVCDEFGITYPEGTTSIKVFVSLINEYLLHVHGIGRKAVLIIEEAQNLTPDVLEQIRLLTNLETSQHKLLQIIMLGQPELRDLLSQPQLRQLSQRITARYHLGPLTRDEIPAYVNHRLSMAGLERSHLFPPSAMKRLYRLSGGIPRLINVICDRALLGTYVEGKDKVDGTTLNTAAKEVSGRRTIHWPAAKWIPRPLVSGAIVVLAVLIGVTYLTYGTRQAVRSVPGALVEAKTLTKPLVRGGTLERPAGQSSATTKDAAYSALFTEWHTQYSASDSRSPCEQAQVSGLRCLKGKGSIASLRQMDSPVVLRLIDGENNEYFAVLTSLSGDAGTFVLGKEKRTADVSELARWWLGDYFVLWRAPPEYKEEVRPGFKGTLVQWVDKQVAQFQGRPSPATPELVYRGELVKAVKRFQVSIGQVPDGIVGPRTIMRLSALAHGDDPTLSRKKGRN
jgi:general secretion pathway protein A